jgi:predicted CXXCH cytochrome family protein
MPSLVRKVGIVAAVIAVLAAAGYFYAISGGLVARKKPSQVETAIAHWLVKWSVPSVERNRQNPLGNDAAGAHVTAGRDLYRQKCEVCHASDGSGVTEAGSGQYPPPRDLRSSGVQQYTDGELFYFIRNGIRNTAMPGWSIPDQQIWRLVVYIRNLPKVAPTEPSQAAGASDISVAYTSSGACRQCHASIYDRWKKTLMANVVRDPREHPDAILPDLSKPNPLVDFTRDDIAFVYGSKWKQRYFKRIGEDYFPLGAQWDVTHKIWRPYKAAPGTDWWTRYFPPDNLQRPTGQLCDGCHSVNYDIRTKSVTEWNVGCESCHGPGGDHVKHATATNILNPAHMDYVTANDVCIQCHSQGQPVVKPLNGKYYDWPVGYRAGVKLSDFWVLEEHKLGEQTFTHFADGTAHKNRMQGNDFVTSRMYTRGVTCFTCHDVHGTEQNAVLRKPASELCLDCHAPGSPNGPRAATWEAHTHHKTGSTGSECIACHMPKIEQTIADVNVRSHTFRFVMPGTTDSLKVPNACNVCHMDKSTRWASDTLSSWSSFSPWRVAN